MCLLIKCLLYSYSRKLTLYFFRGFDSFYGHVGGIIDYNNHQRSIGRQRFLDYFNNDIPLPEKNGIYSTFDFGRETRKIYDDIYDPKFIYLSFNAPHGPLSAPNALIEEMRGLHPKTSESRLIYLAAIKEGFINIKQYI